MDLEELESNLKALRQLYGLLRKDGVLWNLTSDLLDDKSRLLLKNLLDLAAEKVFKVHSEVSEGQVGLSLTKCSNNTLQLGEAWKKLPPALLNPPETSGVIHSCGNSLDDVVLAQFDRDCRAIEPASQRPFTKPILSVTASGFGNRHKYCRICRRPIARNSMEESTVSDTRKGVKVITLPHQQNNQSNYFLWADEKEGLTATSELSECPRTGKNKQRGTTALNCTSGILTDSCSKRPATALIESESVCELTAKSIQESKDLDYLSKEASDVIKQIEMCILDLRRGSGNLAASGNTLVPMRSEAQHELSDMVTDFVPEVESTHSVVLAKSLVVTGSEPSQTLLSARCINDLLNKVDYGQCNDKSRQYQLPSHATGSPTEMKLPNLTASQPLKLLPPRKTMTSPVSSQTNDWCTGLVDGNYVQSQAGHLSEEVKGQNQMVDLVYGQNVKSIVAKIESLNEATSGNCLMPIQIDNCNGFCPDGNKISKKVPLATCFPHQINKEDMYENQFVLEDYIIKPGTCHTPMLSRVSKDYMNRQNIQALDSIYNMNQTWVSRSKKALPWQINKPHSSLDYNPDQVGVQNTTDSKYPSRKILQHCHESDDTSGDSNSSNWISQQTRLSNSDSEEYYLPGQIQKQNYVSPTISSEDDMYSPHPRSQGCYVGERSSDIEAYSWSSSDRSYRLTSYGSDERLKNSFPGSASSDKVFSIGDGDIVGEDYSMYNQPRLWHCRQPRYLSVGSTSKKISPTRVYKSDKGMNPNKRIGRWKKLKDKLSIIFHHHHHHHHHHHNHPDDDPSNHETRMRHGKLRSNQTMKTSHPTRTEAYGEQELGKKGKSVIHIRDHRNPHNHVNALVGGLFKHRRHSKESKPSAKHNKRHNKRFRKGQQEGKKVSAKLHWWQLLQRHRRVKKLGLGYGRR